MRRPWTFLAPGAAVVTLALLTAAAPARADDKADKAKGAAMTTSDARPDESKFTKTTSGLKYFDVKEGTGAMPKKGQTCVMQYTGWLWQNGAKGAKFDSSKDHGKPFEFPIGQHRVIQGWDEGVATMKVGGVRDLIIPPDLGYGARGAGGVIPPNATLFFEVELVGVK